MAEYAAGPSELVEVKAEDIIDERRGFYGTFLEGSKWAIVAVVGILALMAFFLV